MPIYEFVCTDCGHTEEQLQKYSDPPPPCPTHKTPLTKMIGATTFQLKGPGWFKDLYSSAAPTTAASTSDQGKT